MGPRRCNDAHSSSGLCKSRPSSRTGMTSFIHPPRRASYELAGSRQPPMQKTTLDRTETRTVRSTPACTTDAVRFASRAVWVHGWVHAATQRPESPLTAGTWLKSSASASGSNLTSSDFRRLPRVGPKRHIQRVCGSSSCRCRRRATSANDWCGDAPIDRSPRSPVQPESYRAHGQRLSGLAQGLRSAGRDLPPCPSRPVPCARRTRTARPGQS